MNKSFNYIKWLVALLALAGAVIGFQFFQQFSLVIRIIGLCALVALGLGVAATTPKGREALEFVKAAKNEAKRVVWPNRQEVLQSTAVVVVMVLIVTLFVWLVDSLLIITMSWFTG